MTTKKAKRPEPKAVEQPELYEPIHESLQLPRLRWGHAERIYLEHWQLLNRRSPGVNRGFTILEHILCPSDQDTPGPITQRDAIVAACFAQWLGTNCGLAFLREAERRIDSERERGLAEPRHVFPVRFYHKDEFKPARPKHVSTRKYPTNDY